MASIQSTPESVSKSHTIQPESVSSKYTQQENLCSPERAKQQLKEMGFPHWTNVPLGKSDYLNALVRAATSSEPQDLNKLIIESRRDITQQRNR
ncbi:MAG: hypothetical protein ACOX6V_02940 [Patescibacteria group bacterium]